MFFFFFFFNDTATTEIYTLSLHDALPIWPVVPRPDPGGEPGADARRREVRLQARLQVLDLRNLVDPPGCVGDRKSTRLNSSHLVISYAVFCLKKKKIKKYCYILE